MDFSGVISTTANNYQGYGVDTIRVDKIYCEDINRGLSLTPGHSGFSRDTSGIYVFLAENGENYPSGFTITPSRIETYIYDPTVGGSSNLTVEYNNWIMRGIEENSTQDSFLAINPSNGRISIWSSTSDDRLKHNEIDILNALDIIRQLKPQKYQKTSKIYSADYKGDISGDYKIEAGLIAQEILKIEELKFCVRGGDEIDPSGQIIEKPYILSYDDIFIYGLAATKELDAKNSILERKVATLEQEIAELKSELTIIKRTLNI